MNDFYDNGNAPEGSVKMATAALIVGIAAVLFFRIFYLSIPMAAISIILALLSRGGYTVSLRGKLAIIVSSATIIFSASNTAYTIYQIYHDPVLRQQFEMYMEYFERLYSEDEDSSIWELLPRQEQDTPEPAPSAPVLPIEGGEQI